MKHGALASMKISKCIGLQSCIETLHIAIHRLRVAQKAMERASGFI